MVIRDCAIETNNHTAIHQFFFVSVAPIPLSFPLSLLSGYLLHVAGRGTERRQPSSTWRLLTYYKCAPFVCFICSPHYTSPHSTLYDHHDVHRTLRRIGPRRPRLLSQRRPLSASRTVPRPSNDGPSYHLPSQRLRARTR